ncbi:MAG: ABC transporter permease [Actinomycetota bacterium]|nr:FtsX-like permease family protein [Actinomycetota bacterium]
MFSFTYMAKELRRRLGRTILTALGLAAGVGLVIGIIGVSEGLDEAQAQVLAPLGSVGTDILVTRVAGSTTAPTATPTPTPAADQPQQSFGPGGGGFFAGPPGAGRANAANQADTTALLNENNNVVTDLSKLGKPGAKFTHDFFLSATLLSFPQEAVDQIADIPGVTKVTGGLTQLAQHQTGTVPQIVAEITTGGKTVTQTVRPDPMTAEERAAFAACAQKSGGTTQTEPAPSPGAEPRRGGTFFFGPGAAEKCLPKRFQEFRASFITPMETIRQVVNPPSTDITNKSYTAAGIDPASPTVGLVTQTQLTSGHWLRSTNPNEVLANVAYANKNSLKVGSTVAINGTTYTVAGLVNPTLTGNTADLYFPLTSLQKLAGKTGRVTQVLVKAKDSASVDAVAKEIKKLLPGAEVVTTKSLADQVTGSLADAKKVASRLGGALGVIVLIAAFAIAMLLTLSSVAKRVREIGTLRAIGWSKGRVVKQILTETIGIGLLGGAAGIVLGLAAAFAVGAFSPSLSASSNGVPGFASSTLSGLFGQTQAAAHTSTIALKAPVHMTTLAIGVAFAVVGGLLAGTVGGWRAARLSPAEALRNLG